MSFVVLWFLGLYFQLTTPQFQLSIFVNSLNSPLADSMMIYTTYAGDGLFLLFIGLVLVAFNRSLWLVTLLSLSVPSLITQLLKRTIFEDSHRPALLMAQIPELHYVEGVLMNQYNSFPSGHTTAAFSLYTLLALLSISKKNGWFWAVIAAAVGLSRVYLLQHFWADIMAGSILAVCVVTFIYTFFAAKLRVDEITPE
ncbi:MAG: phosphatase PAP2 family protein [Bacteroidota bacterium]